MYKNPWLVVIITSLIIIALALVGSLDYEDEVSQNDVYCSYVKNNVISDYKKVCGGLNE